ncbi:6-phosphofructo-2-kinase/fructose-2,6-bisphosphatase 1 [Chionoecetes opilio]|uniref:6-phosphofructo-2-kinase/fructose-2, 6-bisphosphatase 1 n=1 Tax=Chionoecetes opilio TaxID=41210 RepID=A0A8J4YKS1_CHIOP|nr:6-phosphofructo-2-kinase/fructose-2,6-bisphosphatase 1 [Chionoecetes opilio]
MDYVNIPHVVAMAGLPARGKTYIAMKLARYLNWVGLPTKGESGQHHVHSDCVTFLRFTCGVWDLSSLLASLHTMHKATVHINTKCWRLTRKKKWIKFTFAASDHTKLSTTSVPRYLDKKGEHQKSLRPFSVNVNCDVLCAVFNVGDYRRQAIGDYQGHDFFHPRNREGNNVRNKCALDALQDVCEFLQTGGMVAVYDATNTTIERRQLIHHVICERMGYKLFFIESLCNDPSIIETNIMECKVTNPDYTNMEKEDAVKDFLKRIEHYRLFYEALDEEKESKYSFMKIFDAGRRVVVHKQEGHIESRIAYYLMNIHITPRSIYLTRHGESHYNQLGRIGGDTDLSYRGRQYANALAKFITEQKIANLRVWTSCMKRTMQTASGIEAPQERWKALNEIDAGICEGLMYEEIQEQYPEEFAARDQNKYSYRYLSLPRRSRRWGGAHGVEATGDVLVVGHQAVLRCVLAYFLDKTGVELPYLKVPLHTIIKLTPQAYGCKVEFFKIPIDCVDTHRSKPVAFVSSLETKKWVL